MGFCGTWSATATEHGHTHAIRLYCRSWQCADCRSYRASALRRLAKDGQPRTFITLTVNPNSGGTALDRAAELSNAWRLLVKRIRRRWPKHELEFLAVFEQTRKGEPHLHIIARAPYIPQDWLSAQMDELINAPIVDIRRVVQKDTIIAYIAKYVSKSAQKFGTLKRYWTSGGYDLKRHQKKAEREARRLTWRFWDVSLETLAEQMTARGLQITWTGTDAWWIITTNAAAQPP